MQRTFEYDPVTLKNVVNRNTADTANINEDYQGEETKFMSR